MSSRSALPTSLKFLLVVLILAGGAYAWWRISIPEIPVEPVIREKAMQAVSGNVTVREEIPTPIRAPVGGLVSQADLEIGAVVKAGDFLVQFDTTDVDLEIRAIDDSIKALTEKMEKGSEAVLQVKNAELDFKNAEFNFNNKVLSDVEFQKAKLALEGVQLRAALEEVNNKAQLAALNTALAVRKRQREKMTVKSPVDGQITEVVARKGSLISGEQLLLTIISTTRTVEARISEENFAGVAVGKKATVRFLKYGAQEIGASVAKLLPVADPATQRKVVYLNVDLSPEQLDPGLTGEVSIVVDERENALTIPRRAILGGKVFVVKDGRVELRAVKTGFISLNRAEILQGLSEGEWVLVEELDTVRAGDRVRPLIREANAGPAM